MFFEALSFIVLLLLSVFTFLVGRERLSQWLANRSFAQTVRDAALEESEANGGKRTLTNPVSQWSAYQLDEKSWVVQSPPTGHGRAIQVSRNYYVGEAAIRQALGAVNPRAALVR